MPPRTPRPVQRPVAFAAQDIARADSLIDVHGRLAAAILPEAPDDERQLARLLALTRGANRLLASGDAERGIRSDALAKAANYAGDTHIRDGLDGAWPRRWSAMAIRTMMAASAPLLAEHVSSAAVKVRRESNFIGCDHHHGAGKVKPLLNLYLGALDRQLLAWQIPLTTATECDRTAPRADHDRIRRAEAQLGEPLPATLLEHLELAFAERAACRELLREALGARAELFREAGLDPGIVIDRAFADLVVLEPLPHGPARVPGEAHSQLVLPGDIAALTELAAARGLAGIAACSEAERACELPLPSRPLEFALETMTAWGLAPSPWSTEFRALGDDLLLRLASDDGGTESALWRVFGMRNDDQRALALAQRHSEDWTRSCTRRADRAAPAGLHYPKHPAFRMAVRAFVRFADAARVTAERTRRAAELTD